MPVADETVRKIIDQLKRKIEERRQREHLTFCPRDAHADHHGLVTAEFTVRPDVPGLLRKGLFAAPGRYFAYIRFSNAGGEEHDADVDFRGMAIKVLGVKGERALPHLVPEDERTSQDFHLVNCPVFFVENAERMVEFLEYRKRMREAAQNSDVPLELKLAREFAREFPRTLHAGIVRNPLTIAYFSQTPYKLGDAAVVKYRARPPRVSTFLLGRGYPWLTPVNKLVISPLLRRLLAPDYLRDAMAATFRRGGDVVFEFGIQTQTDPSAMPIEDPTVEWDERQSPFVPVAMIRIPASDNKDFQSAARMALAEHICFSPWHALAAHEPLGSVNRSRLEVYRQMAQYRHAANRVTYGEPTV